MTGPVEGAAIGNLLTQGIALGDVRDIRHLREIVRRSEKLETYTPQDTEEWNRAYGRLLKLMK